MKYSVYQHWDPLKVCMVGRSYNPEFYSFITNPKARTVMERIARETEEDYQKLIKLLESFGVEVIRPTVHDDYKMYVNKLGKIVPPPMSPRDYSIMLGNDFYFDSSPVLSRWDNIKGETWGERPEKAEDIPQWIKDECLELFGINSPLVGYSDNLNFIEKNANILQPLNDSVNAAMITRIGKDLYFGTHEENKARDLDELKETRSKEFPNYRCHIVDSNGHTDGTFCPVVPGLIISLYGIQNYEKTFPGWEVIYLPDQSWSKVRSFLRLKEKNRGKWWVPGEELNDDFTDFVESWLGHWVGYVEETVFDVNMLVIDEKNVVCNNYNKEVFDAFERYGVTPHVINFRHRYFWDGGLHCITSDIHREGTMKDYFPERG